MKMKYGMGLACLALLVFASCGEKSTAKKAGELDDFVLFAQQEIQ